jgi:hypothetical protein
MNEVKISEDLLLDIIRYFSISDQNIKVELEDKIKYQLQDKLDKMVKRELYSEYIKASSTHEKNIAKNKYLEAKGIPEDFRY